jgi:hypothetical protein
MIARHLLWHVGVAAVAIAVLTVLGVPFSSALPIGIMAGCMAMMFGGGHSDHSGHSGHRHEAAGQRARPHQEVDHR